jgi:hypothetical protein
MDLETNGGTLLASDVIPSKNAEWVLTENGLYNNSGPLTVEPGPVRYTCVGNTMREFPDNGSAVPSRQLPSRTTGS